MLLTSDSLSQRSPYQLYDRLADMMDKCPSSRPEHVRGECSREIPGAEVTGGKIMVDTFRGSAADGEGVSERFDVVEEL